MQSEKVTRERVLEVLYYYPETGEFRRTHGAGRRAAGSLAGKVRKKDGYIAIGIDGRGYLAHRLAWLVMKGRWPKDQLDHINGQITDNRILNLRECDNAENQQNIGVYANNTSGYPGVTLSRHGRYGAGICVRGKRKWLGYFDTAKEAGDAYLKAKAELHTFSPSVRGFNDGR